MTMVQIPNRPYALIGDVLMCDALHNRHKQRQTHREMATQAGRKEDRQAKLCSIQSDTLLCVGHGGSFGIDVGLSVFTHSFIPNIIPILVFLRM